MFEPMNFINNLYYMLTGMISIFIVIGVIVLITMGLNKLSDVDIKSIGKKK